MRMTLRTEAWELQAPVAISGYVFSELPLLTVIVEDDARFGRGEAYGVYYRGETAVSMAAQLDAIRPRIAAGVERSQLGELLPPGGARCALDAALWELEAQRSGVPVWKRAGLAGVRPVPTTRTIWGDTPDAVYEQARAWRAVPRLKLKLLGDEYDSARVAAVRDGNAEALLLVDANQGFTRESFERLVPQLVAARVALVEQPYPVQHDAWLDGLRCPIPIAADESFQSLADLPRMIGRFQCVNVKLDKCGGLTEALAIVAGARAAGLGVMVGCMMATSLSMAPAFVAAQQADFADVDGPLYLARDRPYPADYRDHALAIPPELWGDAARPWHREPA